MVANAFTCTGPYAILILLGLKRVENRSAMPVPAKGRCAISCSKSFCKEEYGEFVRWASRALKPEEFERLPSWGDVKDWPGKVVGCCDYEAALSAPAAESSGGTAMWDEGYEYWWELSEVVAFDRPIPCRGNVRMWQLPAALAAQVTAADRLARAVGERIASAADAAELFRLAIPIAGASEGFFVLPLDEDRRVLAEPVLVSLGDPSTTVVQPGEVFAVALKSDAKAIIVAHNHPSGDLTPSLQDRELTARLADLGDRLGVRLLDHFIVGQQGESASVEIREQGFSDAVQVAIVDKKGVRREVSVEAAKDTLIICGAAPAAAKGAATLEVSVDDPACATGRFTATRRVKVC